MRSDENDNIFDKDDALDFMIYDDCEKQGRQQKRGRGGCLGLLILMLIPGGLLALLGQAIFAP